MKKGKGEKINVIKFIKGRVVTNQRKVKFLINQSKFKPDGSEWVRPLHNMLIRLRPTTF